MDYHNSKETEESSQEEVPGKEDQQQANDRYGERTI
jgi:hypothetical protein